MQVPAYRLLVFDWDGTLLDSIAAIVACTQATLVEVGLPAANESDIRAGIGLGLRQIVESFCPACDETTYHRIVDTYRELWFGRFSKEPVLFEGVPRLLDRLLEEGRLLALATAKGRKGLTADLKRVELGRFFCASRTVDEAASKPSPEMLLGILDELGVQAEQALMIGDSVHDLEMARNAGVGGLGVATGTSSREALLDTGPLGCLERVTALPVWLERAAASGPQEKTSTAGS